VAVYQPPDAVVVAIGSAYPGARLVEAGRRLVARARREHLALAPFGLDPEKIDLTEEQLDGLERMLGAPRAQKHDTSLQMKEATALMAETRGWLRSLRLLAGVNLAADTPALHRLASPEPELLEGYPRDLLAELEKRLAAAQDLAPRLADGGLDRAFLTRGRKLAGQLRTAVGPRDLRPEDLQLELRRLYVRKGTVFLELKRWTRMGQLAFVDAPSRAEGWDLREIEPVVPVPIGKKRPREGAP
jgi:hypothetical protein